MPTRLAIQPGVLHGQLPRENAAVVQGCVPFVREYEDEVRAPFPPAPIVKAVMAPLRRMAKRRGHAERYAVPALRPAAAM